MVDVPSDHVLRVLNSDELEDLHTTRKQIDRDFVLEKNESNGEWMIRIMYNGRSCYLGADEYLVALWKSREAMYRIFSEVYRSQTIDGVRQIIKGSKLDMGRIDPGESHGKR